MLSIMRIWSAFDFIPKALAFERAEAGPATEAAARKWSRRSMLRLPLDLLSCYAMLQAFAAVLMHCLRHIARNASAVVDSRDPEGVLVEIGDTGSGIPPGEGHSPPGPPGQDGQAGQAGKDRAGAGERADREHRAQRAGRADRQDRAR